MLDKESILVAHNMWSEDSLIFDIQIEWIAISWKDKYQTVLEYFDGIIQALQFWQQIIMVDSINRFCEINEYSHIGLLLAQCFEGFATKI